MRFSEMVEAANGIGGRDFIEGEVIDEWVDTADGTFHDPRYGHVSGTTRPSIQYINEAGIPEEVVDRHFRRGKGMREIASIIEKWSQSLNDEMNGGAPSLDLFNRTSRFNAREHHAHAMMARVSWACDHDDVLLTLGDVLEGLMWQKCRFELIEDDEQDFWNQWAKRINLDSMLRAMGREDYKVSQFYVGLWWQNASFTVRDDVRGEKLKEYKRLLAQKEYEEAVERRDALIAANAGNPDFIEPPELPKPPEAKRGGNRSRRKQYQVDVPTAYTIFDPTKVVPVGTLMFNRERFAYVASREEDEAFSRVMQGQVADGTVLQLLERKYTPTQQDRAMCGDLGIDPDRLWLFNKDAIFRYTATRSQYERFANVRMKSVLPILEMKEHLRNSDRATLIGNTNFIVVITKGTDKLPAKPAEIENLQAQARTVARLPVLVGDHRLHVEIIAPATDHTLQDSRWQVLDARLVFKALRTFSPVTQGGNSAGAGVKEMSLVVSKGLMNRRHMIVRALEAEVFQRIVDRNPALTESPTLTFMPKRITLDYQADIIGQVLKLRDRGDISRETTLEELDYDQDTEVVRRAQERLETDDVFQSGTPHSSPLMNPFGTPGQLPPGQPGQQPPPGNLGPAGQPRTEGGRPVGSTDTKKRAAKKTAKKAVAEPK